MAWTELFVAAVGLGVAYSAAPGAVNTEALRRGLARGFRPALLVQTGALVGDAVWAALAFAGMAFLLKDRSIQILLGIAGGCFLLRLAWSALQQAWSGGPPGATGRSFQGDFVTGVFFSLANPFGLAFWSGVGGGLAGAGTSEPEAGRFATLLVGFLCGAAGWCLLAATIVGWGQRVMRPGLVRWVGTLSGLTLGYFGLRLLWETAFLMLEGTRWPSYLRRGAALVLASRRVRAAVPYTVCAG